MSRDKDPFDVGHWNYRSYREHLQGIFPHQSIRKLCLNAGFSCPNLDGTVSRGGCTYCNNQGFVPSGLGHKALLDQWDRGRRYLRKRYSHIDGFIAYFQAYSNTHDHIDQLKALYDPLVDLLPECVGLSISTRPDCLSEEKVSYLDELGQRTFLTLELGLQSDRDLCLALTNRGHDTQTFFDALEVAKGRSFEICVHFILGLPEEGEDAPERMGRLAASMPIQSVKVHNLHVMSGTQMAKEYQQGQLKVMAKEEYLCALKKFVKELRSDQCFQRVLADAPSRLLLSGGWCQNKQSFLTDFKASLGRSHVHLAKGQKLLAMS